MLKQDFGVDFERSSVFSSQAQVSTSKNLPCTKVPIGGSVKRCIDFSIALIAILAISPLLTTIWCVVRLNSSGPGLFKQQRGGLGGKPFNIYKFRTMVGHSGEFQQAVKGDKRITRIGKYLRISSLDELPQLFNVLKGDMSLIGPRPHVLSHDEEFIAFDPRYSNRFRARPGITGLAQVSGARGPTDTNEKKRKRIDLDNEYIEKWSLINDMKIIIKTALTIFGRSKGF